MGSDKGKDDDDKDESSLESRLLNGAVRAVRGAAKRIAPVVKSAAEKAVPVLQRAAEKAGPDVADFANDYIATLAELAAIGGKKAVSEGVKLAMDPQGYITRKRSEIEAAITRADAAIENGASSVAARFETENALAVEIGPVAYAMMRGTQAAQLAQKGAATAADTARTLLAQAATASAASPGQLFIEGMDVVIGEYTDPAKGIICGRRADEVHTFVSTLSTDAEFNAAFGGSAQRVQSGYDALRLYTGLATIDIGEVLEHLYHGGNLPGKVEEPEALSDLIGAVQQHTEMLDRKRREILEAQYGKREGR